jgi:thiol-disulfide isomerase/thioredoxin
MSQTKRERRALAKQERERAKRRANARRRLSAWGLGLVGIVVAVLLVSSLIDETSGGGVAFAGDLRPGGTLESLSLPVLEGEGTVEYASMDDRPLVINFFASWCPNCIAEMPDFEQVNQDLDGRVGFLGISQGDAPGASIALAHETGITYPSGLDERGRFFRAVGGVGMPTTIFVLPGGEIADVWVGGLDRASLEALVQQHFGIAAN